MKTLQNRSWLIVIALIFVMALTRFKHFGSDVALPDASLAVFFLGGLYLARFKLAGWIFAALLVEAVAVDYFAIVVQGTSAWCVTDAYGFLAFAYAAMWFAGRWFAPQHDLSAKRLLGMLAVVASASIVAFVISNVSFFLLSGRYADMSALEYASRVAQYLGSYVAVALVYVSLAVAIQKGVELAKGKAPGDAQAS